jgi:hypothetical protein
MDRTPLATHRDCDRPMSPRVDCRIATGTSISMVDTEDFEAAPDRPRLTTAPP